MKEGKVRDTRLVFDGILRVGLRPSVVSFITLNNVWVEEGDGEVWSLSGCLHLWCFDSRVVRGGEAGGC